MAADGSVQGRKLDCVVASGAPLAAPGGGVVRNTGRDAAFADGASQRSARQALLSERGERELRSASPVPPPLSSRRIVKCYLWGQLANVVKAAFWWSSFGVLSAALLQRPLAIGLSRAAFNMALLLLSPTAAALCERVSVRSLLVKTTLTRLALWGFCFPGAFVLLQLLLQRNDLLLGAALVLMFVDGAAVALGNLADVDCGGLDLLSAQFGLVVSQRERSRCCALHQTVFDCSFIFLTPPLAFAVYLAAVRLFPETAALESVLRNWTEIAQGWLPPEQTEPLLLLLCTAGIFGLLSLFSLSCYVAGLPPRRALVDLDGGVSLWTLAEGALDSATEGQEEETQTQTQTAQGSLRSLQRGGDSGDFSVGSEDSFTDLSVDADSGEEGGGSGSDRRGASLWAATKARVFEVWAGLGVACSNKALGFRLLFLAAETALEDCLVSLLLPLLCLHADGVFGGRPGPAAANAWCCAVIACGKIGGCLSSLFMGKYWRAPPVAGDSLGEYRVFFFVAAAAGASLLLLPGAVYLQQQATPVWVTSSMVLVAAFCYFFLNTIPKVGFASLLQGLVTSQGEACRVFGFVGVFVTLVDALAILFMNLLFNALLHKGVFAAVASLVAVYALHGVVEAALGPCLVLRRGERALSLAETAEEAEQLSAQRQRESTLLDPLQRTNATGGEAATMRPSAATGGGEAKDTSVSRTSTTCPST